MEHFISIFRAIWDTNYLIHFDNSIEDMFIKSYKLNGIYIVFI